MSKIPDFKKYLAIQDIKYIASLLEEDAWSFYNELELHEEFEINESYFNSIECNAIELNERSNGNSDSNFMDKAKKVWNFISGKGSKIKSLGKQLENAIRIKINSVLLTKVKMQDETDQQRKARVLDMAKEKQLTAAEVETQLKDKIDTVADGDSRLEKIASLTKQSAAIKPNQEKIKLIQNLEYSEDTIAKEKEKQKDRIEKVKEKTVEVRDDLKNAKEKASNSNTAGTNPIPTNKNPESTEKKEPTKQNDKSNDSVDSNDSSEKRIERFREIVETSHDRRVEIQEKIKELNAELTKDINIEGIQKQILGLLKESQLLLIKIYETKRLIAKENGNEEKIKEYDEKIKTAKEHKVSLATDN